MSTFGEPIRVAIIGGTGLYDLDDFLHYEATIEIDTPWGKPSSPITVMRLGNGEPIAFLARHGRHHQFSPSTVPNQANIAALKHLGVTTILAFSAVGSLRQELRPRDFVLPNQVIDRTKGIRPSTFFGTGMVAHVSFGEPFDPQLTELVAELTKDAMPAPAKIHSQLTADNKEDITLVCMEGPAFSTRAESHMYRMFGGDVINMSCLPESKLAKEAEISYTMACMVTDYDAWRAGEEAVTVETVIGNLRANSESARSVLTHTLDTLTIKAKKGEIGQTLVGTMKFSASTHHHARDPKLTEALEFILPGYYSEGSQPLKKFT